MLWTEFSTYIRHLSPADQIRVERAFLLGSQLHAGQLRKSGEPYFTHPVAIAIRLAYLGADTDTIIATLLHDTVEDTPITLEEINKEFDGDVTALIDGVTKLTASEFETQPNLDEQVETLRKMFRLMQQDLRIMVIKLFDRLHNMETIKFLSPEKQQTLAQETYDVYVKIADRLCMQDIRYELEGMCLSVLQPDIYKQLSELRDQGKELSRIISKKMVQYIAGHADLKDTVKVHFEFKSWQKLQAQFSAAGSAVTGVANATMIFVCNDRDTCYRVLGAIHAPWKRETMSFQDFINSPMINGYQGLHTTIILEDGTRVRCKIRTKEMQEYARKGVTTICFKPERREELEQLLPWTQRINSVAEDTRFRSNDFWQSLQSDILGESITVHGPDDRTVQLPKGATALDGAFYLFEENALMLQSIKIDGREMPLGTPLTEVVTLDGVFAEKPTVDRQWLRWVATGYATARIRTALAGESEETRIAIGREMLQEVMVERHKGFLEEFDESILTRRLESVGYKNLSGVFTAIADGRVEAADIFTLLFNKNIASEEEKRLSLRIRYEVNMEDIDKMDRLNRIHKNYSYSLQEITYRKGKDPTLSQVILKATLSNRESTSLREQLQTAGAENIEVIMQTKREIGLLAIVICLWSLNPVAAKWLLNQGMTPLSLLTTRFLIFSLFTTGFFFLWRWITKATFTTIPRLTLVSGPPAFWNAFNSAFTYLALLFLPASIHLTILRFNTLLIAFRDAKNKKQLFLAILLLALLIVMCTFLILNGYIILGVIFSAVTLLSYTFYSLSLERTLHQNHIDIRYPYLLFHMGLLLGATGIVMACMQPLSALWHQLTIWSILYVIVCVCIPHACYSALLKTARFKHFTDYFLLEVPLAMALEAYLLHTVLSLSLYLTLGITIVTLLVFQWRKTIVAIE